MQESSRKLSPVKERILQFIDIQGISNYKFYALTGIAHGSLSKSGGMGEEGLVRIFNYYPDLNPEWVLLGTGPIEKTKSPQNLIVQNTPINDKKNDKEFVDKQKVHKILSFVEDSQQYNYSPDREKLYTPYLPSQNFSLITANTNLEQYPMYLIPGLRKADFIIHYYSEDMHPTVMAGNYIAGKILKISALNSWGRIHLFELEDHGVIMGRLKTGSDSNSVRCEPENPSFGTIEFQIDHIVAVARLMAVIKIL